MPEATSPRTPRPLFATLGRLLETALNRVVDLDAETRTRLRALDGRAVTLDLGAAAPAVRLRVDGERLRVGPAFEGDSALRVASTPGALLALALRRDDGVPAGKVQIAGDADLARRLEQIATRFSPDFDAAFASTFGDVVGFQIARAVRGALHTARGSAKSFARDAAEFLSEEGRDLVPRAELDAFLDEVDEVRERGDRIKARVERLARSVATDGQRRA